MKKIAAFLFMMLTAVSAFAGTPREPLERPEETSVVSFASTKSASDIKSVSLRLEWVGEPGVCSATIVGPNLIMTAAHCLPENKEIKTVKLTTLAGTGVNIVQVDIAKTWVDKSDHAFLLFNVIENTRVFRIYATIGPWFQEGQNFEYYGNPYGLSGIYRRGYVSIVTRDSVALTSNGWKGDSGAGIFDEYGRVMGIVSALYGTSTLGGPAFSLLLSYNWSFTPQDWNEISQHLGRRCQQCAMVR